MVPGGDYGIFQARIWEASYGNTYEAAVAAPPANGRGALLGKPKLLRVLTGDPQAIIPATPGNLPASGLESIEQTVDNPALALMERLAWVDFSEARFDQQNFQGILRSGNGPLQTV